MFKQETRTLKTAENLPASKLFRMGMFSAFCDSTSLHGWPHIPGSTSSMSKIFWGVTILAMGVLAVFLCTRYIYKSPSFELQIEAYPIFTHKYSSTVKQFTTSTVSTSLISSTEPIELATFPKVVICNKYKLR